MAFEKFLVFPSLFILSLSSSQLERDMKPVMDLHDVVMQNETYISLIKTISYTFPRHVSSSCLSIETAVAFELIRFSCYDHNPGHNFEWILVRCSGMMLISGDKSLFSEKFYQTATERGDIPPIVILDRSNRFKCKSILVVVDDAEGLRSILKNTPLYPNNRIWCLVNQGTLQDLQTEFQDTQSVFGDANVIIFSFGEYDQALRIEQPDRIFELIEIPEGEIWPVMTNHIKAFSGVKLRYSTANCDVHMSFTSDQIPFNWGLDWKIFEEITKGMNLITEYVEIPEDSEDPIGLFVNGSWKGGILGNIATRKADIGFCGIFLDISKFRGVLEMGNPLRSVCVKYAVLRPKLAVESSSWVVYASFSLTVYSCVLITLILFATTIRVVASSDKVVGKIPTGYNTFTYCLTTSWGLMLQGYYTRISRMGVIRRFLFVWAIFSLLFSTSFSSHLVSNFTRPLFTPLPQSVADLVDMGYSSPRMMNFPMEFVLNVQDPTIDKWLKRGYEVSKFEDLLDILRTDSKTAVLGQIFDSRPYFIAYTPEGVPDEILDMYETMDTCIANVYEAFAFRKGSPFRAPINEYLMNLARYGLLKKYHDDILTQVSRLFPSVKFVLQKSSSVAVLRPLSIFHLKGVFVALIIGHALSVLVFIGELMYHCFQVTRIPEDVVHNELLMAPIMSEFIY